MKTFRSFLLSALACATVLLCATAPPPAEAAGTTAIVSWTIATESTVTDPVTGVKTAQPLPLSLIKETLIKWSTPDGREVGQRRIAVPAVTTTVEGLICGNYNFVAVTVLKDNAFSADSQPPAVHETKVSCVNPKAPAVTTS